MRANVLGTVQLVRGGKPVDLPSGNLAAVFRRLLLEPNEVVSADDLIAEVWSASHRVPQADRRRLQVTVSRLRSFVADASEEHLRWSVDTVDGGYLLRVDASAMDRVEFEELARLAMTEEDASAAKQALGLWRGAPYGGFPASATLTRQARRLGELRRRLLDLAHPPGPRERWERAKVRAPWPAGRVVARTLASTGPRVGDVPVLAVVAPAGFGKSTFLAQWAVEQPHPVAWITLDESDADPVRFWAGIGRALDEVLGPTTDVDDDRAGSNATLDRLGDRFESGFEFAIVVDDVHVLADHSAASPLSRLIESMPPGCTVALASRHELPTPVSARLADGSAQLVGPAELRFSEQEVSALVGGDRRAVAQLLRATDGWPVALAAIHRSGADVSDAPSSDVERYVTDEILEALPEHVRSLLIHVAYLDDFTVDLCEVATGREDAGAALGWLRDRGLFVVDSEPGDIEGWCHIHPVVAEVARRRGAGSVNVRRIWRRAARWCQARGLSEAALDYAVRARERELIAEEAGGVLLDAALRGEAVRCVQWLERIDPEDLVADPQAHGIGVYLATEWMDRDDRGAWLRSRQRHFGGDDPLWTLVTAIEAMREGRSTQAVELSEQVMHRCLEGTMGEVGELSTLLLGSAFSNLIRARVLQGSTSHDDTLFPSAVSLIRPQAPVLAAWISSYWGIVAFVDGAGELAESLAEEFFQASVAKELGRPIRRDNFMLGAILAGSRTSDHDALAAIAEGVSDLPTFFESKGQYTEATMALLVVSRTFRRAGSTEQAEPFERRAAALMRTFPDAPFLERLRQVLFGQEIRVPSGVQGPSADVLTPRQQEIARYLATDLSAEAIAEALFISYQTLRTHLREIYRRLGVHSRHEAVGRLTGFSSHR